MSEPIEPEKPAVRCAEWVAEPGEEPSEYAKWWEGEWYGKGDYYTGWHSMTEDYETLRFDTAEEAAARGVKYYSDRPWRLVVVEEKRTACKQSGAGSATK